MATTKGFIQDWLGNNILPITRGELVLDQDGNVAFNSKYFLAGANGNGLPGLITAAERAMLSGSSGTGGIADIYTKLGHINTGLIFKNIPVNFYDSTGKSTPISIIPATGIEIGVANNIVSIGLSEIGSETTVTNVLKSITVDKYGRVTAVSGSTLTNAEIPSELSDKTLKDSTITNGVTGDTEIGTDEKAIANKAYVDKKFNEVTGIATGALKFGGPINDATDAKNALSNKSLWNSYFKVTGEFIINTSDLYDTTGIVTDTIKVKLGDTLIIYPNSESAITAKFVYIPSGDDITAITVKGDSEETDALTSKIGNVTLKFSSLFSVKNNPSGSNTAYISIPIATSLQDGYLSKTDFAEFKNYASQLKVDYTGEFSNGTGVYKIGTLTIGTDQKEIFGKYNVSSLSLTDGADSVYNPILKFTETGATDVDITLKGFNGILIKRNGSTVEFGAANEVIEQDVPQEKNPRKTKYLTIDNGYQFGVQIGRADAFGNVEQDGLTDFSQFNALVNRVSIAATFEAFTYSLSDAASTTEYRYGNDLLKEAINVTI